MLNIIVSLFVWFPFSVLRNDGYFYHIQRGNTKLFMAARAVVSKHYPAFTQEAVPMHMMEWAQMIEMDKQRGITKA